jgi:hypothetical protein
MRHRGITSYRKIANCRERLDNRRKPAVFRRKPARIKVKIANRRILNYCVFRAGMAVTPYFEKDCLRVAAWPRTDFDEEHVTAYRRMIRQMSKWRL